MPEGPPRLLVVDDNAPLVENLREILEEAGYATAGCVTCAEARAAAAAGFDVALVDLRLPDGAGTTLAAELKAIAPDAEVVLLTGFASMETAVDAVRAGAFAYLMKPCAPPQLLLTVEQALRQVRLRVDKRQLAHKAMVAEKLAAVGTLTAGLSHEIRNPLNAAGLQLTILERRIGKLPQGEQGPLVGPLRLVQEEIHRLDHILQDFLQFARPREMSAVAVDLSALLARVLDFLQGDAERRGVRIERRLAPVPTVAGDEERLRQVAMNLTLNALDAAGSGGWVRVSTTASSNGVSFTVEDSGRGISEEARDRIFEPFYTTKAAGTGLGLPIVHAIVSQHGGAIALGNASGGGARFEVTLPASPGRSRS
jgi:signal transduction histidine kinase